LVYTSALKMEAVNSYQTGVTPQNMALFIVTAVKTSNRNRRPLQTSLLIHLQG
jgi:hypothetical protein